MFVRFSSLPSAHPDVKVLIGLTSYCTTASRSVDGELSRARYSAAERIKGCAVNCFRKERERELPPRCFSPADQVARILCAPRSWSPLILIGITAPRCYFSKGRCIAKKTSSPDPLICKSSDEGFKTFPRLIGYRCKCRLNGDGRGEYRIESSANL